MFGVVRARSGLGMVLHREDGERPVPHAFDGVVVEIHVRHFDIAGK